MNTDPRRPDISDQPWLGEPQRPHPAMAAFGFWPRPSPQPDQPGLSLAIQPRHSLSCGTLCAAEASLRADTFPIDPEYAARLSGWVIESACHEAQDWNAMNSRAITVSVRLPAHLLTAGTLVSQVRRALARSSLVPWHLELQLPAVALTHDDPNTLLSLAALRDLGIGLGLGHFGTLAASPRMLQRLPLTAVTLDPILVRDLVPDRTARLTVKAAIALAHALNTAVIASNVKTPTQRDILADLGCDRAQGPLYGGPLRTELFHASLLVPSLP
jgi:EAL domain-containing protein (putative c-di-GMP-specific phosphodiesterase class I)